MNTPEDRYIASAMRSMGRTPEAPADGVRQIVTRAKRRNTIGRVVSTAGAVVVSVAFVVAGAAAVVQVNDAEESVVATSTASPAPTGWQQLTGKTNASPTPQDWSLDCAGKNRIESFFEAWGSPALSETPAQVAEQYLGQGERAVLKDQDQFRAAFVILRADSSVKALVGVERVPSDRWYLAASETCAGEPLIDPRKDRTAKGK